MLVIADMGTIREILTIINNKIGEISERIEEHQDLISKLDDEILKFKYEMEIKCDKSAIDELTCVAERLMHTTVGEILNEILS